MAMLLDLEVARASAYAAPRQNVRPRDFSREHADPLAEWMTPIALDRHRIVHAAAFRRLQHKTQVFLTLRGDHFRTRLTHTLEVAELARLLAEALGLNAELAEVVALAHDLGHPPFGHAGERTLNELMAEHGGFEHNVHALRVVEYLEHPYPEFRGLNLTHVVRECLAKHTTTYDRPGRHPLQDGKPAALEGQIADLADALTYTLHDLQDGLHADLLRPEELAEIELWRRATDDDPPVDTADARRRLRKIIDRMHYALVADLVHETLRKLDVLPTPVGGARSAARPDLVLALSNAMQRQFDELGQFLRARLYREPRLQAMDARATAALRTVFRGFIERPERLPQRYVARVAEQGPARVVADYVAGMTDRYCLRAARRLTRSTRGV